ncbi:MAG: tetratricopeptide repeat protein, partial [Saprospiraceae bacterium]|nr:tetratricopeptide repeat protein [Saprospiraceae bacterium]
MYTRFFCLLLGVGFFGALPRAAAANPDSLLTAALDAAQGLLDKREEPSTRKAIALLQQTNQNPVFQQADCALRSMLHHKIGVGYYRLSEYHKALVFLRDSALQTRLQCLGKTHPETGNSLYVTAMAYKYLENLPQAAQYLSRAIETLEAQPGSAANQQKLAGYYEENASLYESQGDYRTAARYLRQAQKMAEQLGTFEGARKAKWLFRAGSLALSDQQYPSALEHYSAALALYQSLADADYAEPIANCHQNLGKIFLYHGPDLKKAEAYALQASAAYQRLPAAAANLSLSYELLGLIAKRRRQWPDAIRYFQKALSLREKSGSAELVANAWENLGDVYMATQKPEKALRAYRLGIRSTQKTDILRAGRLRAEALLQLAASRPNGGYLDEALLLYASLDSVATEL